MASNTKKNLSLGTNTDTGMKKDTPNPYAKKKDVESNKETQEDDESNDNSTVLLFAFIAMLIFQLGNRIFGKLQTYPMFNYPMFMNMLSVFLYVPLCFAYILPMLQYPEVITPEQRKIPKYKFAVMGGYDSIAGIMQVFSVNYITNSGLIVLIQQSAIPISMLISKLTLNSSYTKPQYLGAAVVLLGIVVVLIPTLTAPKIDGAADSSGQLMWYVVLVVSCVPMCLSSVYKEKALGEVEINIVYLNGWVAIYQLLLAIPLAIPSSMIINLPLNQIMPNMYEGFLCWFGYNTVTEDYNPNHLPLDDCSAAPFYVTAYLFFNIVYNYLIVVILKHGSANILWMASTIIVPLSNVVFSMKFMPNSQPMKFFDLLGLAVIMIGLLIYRFTAQLLELVDSIIGKKINDDEQVTSKKMRSVSKKSVRNQAKYVGLNQLESLNAVVDTRVIRDQKTTLHKSTTRIRSSLLMKLGIPPSPMITIRSPRLAIGAQMAPPAPYDAIAPATHGFMPMSRPHSFIERAPNKAAAAPSPYQMINADRRRERELEREVELAPRSRAGSLSGPVFIPSISRSSSFATANAPTTVEEFRSMGENNGKNASATEATPLLGG